MNRLRIKAQPDSSLAAKLFQAIEKSLSHDAFAIVTHDHGRRGQDSGFERGQQAARRRAVNIEASFAIQTHDLLLMRDDAHFDARGPSRVSKQSATIDSLFREEIFQS